MKNYSRHYRNLCLNLLTLRKIKNLDQSDFARKCGLSRYQYTRIEGSHVNPPMESIFKICDAFDLQVGDLFKDPFNDSLKMEKREPVFIRQNQPTGVQEERYTSSINKNVVVRKFTLQGEHLSINFDPQLSFEKDDRENIKIGSLHGAEILLIQTILH